jgi:hypothetical protein
VLTEVKNVASLTFTNQLQDYAAIAQRDGLQFDLIVRKATQISGPLQQAFVNGLVNIVRALP